MKSVIISLLVLFCFSATAQCEDELVKPSQATLHFPRELKMDERWVPLAMDTHPQGPLAKVLGTLMAKAESQLDFWSEAAQAVAEPVESHDPFSLTGLLLQKWQLSTSAPHLARIEALVPKLILHFHEVLTEDEIILLAYLLRDRPVNIKTAFERVPLQLWQFEESVESNPLITMPPGRWQDIQKVLDLRPEYQDYVVRLGGNDGFILALLRANGFAEMSIDPETLKTVRSGFGFLERMSQKFDKRPGGNVIRAVDTYTVVTMSFIGLMQEAMKNPEMRTRLEHDPRVILDEIEDVFVPIFDVRTDMDHYIQIVDLFLWDTPLPDKGEEVRRSALESARALFLSFKGEVSRLKGNAKLEEQRARAASLVHTVLEVGSFNPFRRPPQIKVRVKTRGQARPVEELGVVTGGERGIEKDLFDLTHFKMGQNSFELSEGAYQFRFIRNPEAGVQTVRIGAEALTELRSLPEKEARRLLGAFVMGYTNRSARASSGVKRLYRNGDGQIPLYEARPGRSSLRLILTRQNSGEWTVLGVVDKVRFDKSIERRF